MVNVYFEKIKLTVAFKSPNGLGNHFPFKDKVKNKNAETFIVYKIKFQHCETKRIITTRVQGHKNSALLETNHQNDYENFQIIDKANNDLKLSYKEILYIRKQMPAFNTKENSELFT